MCGKDAEVDAISYNAAISACDKDEGWQKASQDEASMKAAQDKERKDQELLELVRAENQGFSDRHFSPGIAYPQAVPESTGNTIAAERRARRNRGLATARKNKNQTKSKIVVNSIDDFNTMYTDFTKQAGESSCLEEALEIMEGFCKRCVWQCPHDLEAVGREAMTSARQ